MVACKIPSLVILLLVTANSVRSAETKPDEQFRVTPNEVVLDGNFARVQLVVEKVHSDPDRSKDITSRARFVVSDPQIATVSKSGRLVAVGDGATTVTVSHKGQDQRIAIRVSNVESTSRVGFSEHIVPILSKAGCNMGACHASQHGKGGFKLSVFGFDPKNDWQAIVRQDRQRRINFVSPQDSLLLQKPTLQVPHGGSRRLSIDSVDHRILVKWIASGAPGPNSKAPKVSKVIVFPTRRIGNKDTEQQLRVDAVYSNGSVRDVTAWAKFDSMDDSLLQVTREGRVSVVGTGQAPILVRFEGQAAISMFVIPTGKPVQLTDWKDVNFIDQLAAAKFAELGIEPSPICDDATFIRRAYLDAIGTLPKPDETLAFLDDSTTDKRSRLIDRLLGLTGDPALDIHNDAYAAYWTLKWSDLIRNSSSQLGEQGMWALHNWIKESFRTNKPFDRFVRELVTAKGSIYMNGPANFFRINANASVLAESTAQLFLGIRLECAKCHHHPFEKYSQADYQQFSRFFSQVKSKRSEEFGLFGRETVITVQPNPAGKATNLDGEVVSHPLDLRIPLADWLTSPDNKYFSKSVVNRYMGYLLGRGLVDPIDDLRSTNPPTNVALMNALEKDFVDHKFNLKHLVRTIMVSRLYQLQSQPSEQNAFDRRFYSHFKVKRLLAEPLLDSIDHVTLSQTKFKSLPLGTRAIELPDAGDIYPNYFLATFAKPKRASVCECERSLDANLAQALHTLNGDILAEKIAHKTGRVAKLLVAKRPHDEIVRELYLATLCRFPSQAEMELSRKFLVENPNPKEVYEDLLWALINSKQFLFVH